MLRSAALLVVCLASCGGGSREGGRSAHVATPAAPASRVLPTDADAGTTAAPQRLDRPDIDLEKENAPLAIAFSPAGHLLFATRRALWDWDPSGVEKTKQITATPEALFGAGVRLVASADPDYVATQGPKGKTTEEWRVRAAFSEDGAVAAFSADSETFARKNDDARRKFVASVLRTDTGASAGAFTRIVSVRSPLYTFAPNLSPAGRFLMLVQAEQAEVFEVASGRNVLRQLGEGGIAFLNDATLLRSGRSSLDVVDAETGRVLRTRRASSTRALSPDRKTFALFEKGTLRFWNLATGTLTTRCKTSMKCSDCAVEWTDASHVRLFDGSEKETQIACAADGQDPSPSATPYAALPTFEGEGFSVFEHRNPGATRPSGVVVMPPKGGKEVALDVPGAEMPYSVSRGRLLVRGETTWLVESSGEVRLLVKAP